MLSLKNFVPYCGRQMEVLCENGWHTGNINYYNDNTQKYHVIYDDDTEDYIGENEIYMVEIREVWLLSWTKVINVFMK